MREWLSHGRRAVTPSDNASWSPLGGFTYYNSTRDGIQCLKRHFIRCIICLELGDLFSGTQDPVTTFVELAGRGGSEARRSERLALAFGLDAKGLLELSGDIRLCERDFSNAISLYRMAGCKHLKVVLKFAASGNVHELLSYLNVLFKGQSINYVCQIL